MSRIVLLALGLAACLAAFTTEASAVVCAKGVHRAGCVGPNGAAIGRRTYYRGGVAVHGYRRPGAAIHGRTVIRRY